MKRIIALSALLLALVACGQDETPKSWTQDRFSAAEVHEEDPGFDCRIHGNRICGPVRVDIDGRLMLPVDMNGDGRIVGDIEMGS